MGLAFAPEIAPSPVIKSTFPCCCDMLQSTFPSFWQVLPDVIVILKQHCACSCNPPHICPTGHNLFRFQLQPLWRPWYQLIMANIIFCMLELENFSLIFLCHCCNDTWNVTIDYTSFSYFKVFLQTIPMTIFLLLLSQVLACTRSCLQGSVKGGTYKFLKKDIKSSSYWYCAHGFQCMNKKIIEQILIIVLISRHQSVIFYLWCGTN